MSAMNRCISVTLIWVMGLHVLLNNTTAIPGAGGPRHGQWFRPEAKTQPKSVTQYSSAKRYTRSKYKPLLGVSSPVSAS